MGEANDTFTYRAIAIRQQSESPPMYVLGIAADELLEWADVPSAKADYMAGYQRVYNKDRAKAITQFLSLSPKNIIPGAIIVTVNADDVAVKLTEDSTATVKIELPKRPFTESLQKLYDQFHQRLSESEIDSVALGVDASSVQEDDVDEAGIPESYLASLTSELKQALDDFESLPKTRQIAIKAYVESVSKPGLIIDGQHRVFGAKDVAQHSVILPVVLLPGLAFSEQVFHFYVLNNKAKPLTPTELRRTISTSLTNNEIDELWERFEDAGIDPEATRWTHKINTNPESPFVGLIDFGLGGDGFLKENVAFQLVSKFVKMKPKYRILYKGISAFENEDDGRLDYFYIFWKAIKDIYSEIWLDGVKSGGNQLFQKASMIVLQEYILDNLAQITSMATQLGDGVSPFKDLADLDKAVRGSLNFLPAAFFSTEWQVKQVDTTEGHKFLRGQIELAVQNQGKFLGNQQLFKKQQV
jgi:hypothetical protein